jgi:Uma2 family endonuclease
MPTVTVTTSPSRGNGYPTSDGRPMAETDLHRDLMSDLIYRLQDWFAPDPQVYVSGNLLIYYVTGNKRKHVAPDVFVVRGVGKYRRENYLMWEEGKGPDAIIEVTSKTTRKEDTEKKFVLYRDVLRVSEYFLRDPKGDYLQPALKGFRLIDGDYVPIEPVAGRLPSAVLGLHLEPVDFGLKLFDPVEGRCILNAEERKQQENEKIQQLLKSALQRYEVDTKSLFKEIGDLRHEVEQLKLQIRPAP